MDQKGQPGHKSSASSQHASHGAASGSSNDAHTPHAAQTGPSSTIDPCEFVATVKPLLERRDHEGLLALCKQRYTPEAIVSLLTSTVCDARKVAALGLSLVGGKCCLEPLVARLKDPDPMVSQMAEHAMWAIWFRGGSPEANHQLCRGIQAIGRREIDHAISHFDSAIELCPTFPEVFNQRAIAYYLKEDYERSLADCRRTVELMPLHFGAWSGMGHCHASLGDFRAAVKAYETALAIHPHLDGVHKAVCEIRSQLDQIQ